MFFYKVVLLITVLCSASLSIPRDEPYATFFLYDQDHYTASDGKIRVILEKRHLTPHDNSSWPTDTLTASEKNVTSTNTSDIETTIKYVGMAKTALMLDSVAATNLTLEPGTGSTEELATLPDKNYAEESTSNPGFTLTPDNVSTRMDDSHMTSLTSTDRFNTEPTEMPFNSSIIHSSSDCPSCDITHSSNGTTLLYETTEGETNVPVDHHNTTERHNHRVNSTNSTLNSGFNTELMEMFSNSSIIQPTLIPVTDNTLVHNDTSTTDMNWMFTNSSRNDQNPDHTFIPNLEPNQTSSNLTLARIELDETTSAQNNFSSLCSFTCAPSLAPMIHDKAATRNLILANTIDLTNSTVEDISDSTRNWESHCPPCDTTSSSDETTLLYETTEGETNVTVVHHNATVRLSQHHHHRQHNSRVNKTLRYPKENKPEFISTSKSISEDDEYSLAVAASLNINIFSVVALVFFALITASMS